MGRPKKQIEVQQIEQPLDPNRMWSNIDKQEIMRLFKVAIATQKDMDSIYHLFKKYVNPNARMYVTNCNCGGSINQYWRSLLTFYSDNSQKFEP